MLETVSKAPKQRPAILAPMNLFIASPPEKTCSEVGRFLDISMAETLTPPLHEVNCGCLYAAIQTLGKENSRDSGAAGVFF
jgi:hypothetical protein